MKNKRKKRNLIGVLLIAFFMVLILLIISTCFPNKKEKYYTVDSRVELYENFQIENTEIIGWIKVQGTNIDYPVIKETNEAYYSGIDYIWQPNTYKAGENREAIYGHNILNVSSNPIINGENHTRFEPLMSFVYEEFAKENLYIQYTYNGEDHLYKIYAVTFLYASEDLGLSIKEEENVNDYIKNAKKKSLYDYDVEVNASDHIISLITCTRYFGITGKTQFRVDAREVRKNENIDRYSVEINENYDIIK